MNKYAFYRGVLSNSDSKRNIGILKKALFGFGVKPIPEPVISLLTAEGHTGTVHPALKSILYQQLGTDKSLLRGSHNLRKHLNADSLDIVELMLDIEERTGKKIPDAVMDKCHTVGDLNKFFDKK